MKGATRGWPGYQGLTVSHSGVATNVKCLGTAVVLSGPMWTQVDGIRLVEPERPHLYATAILVNENVHPQRQCEMRLMIDTSSGMELVIPKRMAQQLHLVPFYETTAEGYGGRVQRMCVYKVVVVKLPSTASDGGQETFKQAQLTVSSTYEAVGSEDDEEDLSNIAGFKQAQEEGGALQLSPSKELTQRPHAKGHPWWGRLSKAAA